MTEQEIIARAQRLSAQLPEVETAPHYGRPWLKVAKKALAGPCRHADTLAVHCPLELKHALIEARPDIYYDTDHFRGWPVILVRMEAIDDDTLEARIEAAWKMRAPPRLIPRDDLQL